MLNLLDDFSFLIFSIISGVVYKFCAASEGERRSGKSAANREWSWKPGPRSKSRSDVMKENVYGVSERTTAIMISEHDLRWRITVHVRNTISRLRKTESCLFSFLLFYSFITLISTLVFTLFRELTEQTRDWTSERMGTEGPVMS